MSQTKVHVYPTFFMNRLHNESAEARGYNFEAVITGDGRIDGGLKALDELYTPINEQHPLEFHKSCNNK